MSVNYIEFRRALSTDPADPQLDAVGASLGPEAQQALRDARQFDQDIVAALAVPIPPGLEDRLLGRLANERRSTPKRHAPWLIAALAASALLATVLWNRGAMDGRTERMIQASVAHLSHEPFALTRTERVPAPLIERAFATAGLKVEGERLPLSYLMRCPVDDFMTLHMVIRARSGPVTALLIPDRTAERLDVKVSGVAARSMPYVSGAVILLAESDRDFDTIETLFYDAGPAPMVAGGSR